MPTQSLELFPNVESHLDVYSENKQGASRPAIIVCPGGAYSGLAAHEGAPFAELFASNGYAAFVLHYRVKPHTFPAPIADACRAVRLVRERAHDLGVDPNRVALMGFSAGGHLVATVATQPDLVRDEADDLQSKHSARPDRLILGYPVISFADFGHLGSAINLCGSEPGWDKRRQLSNELHVTKDNPSTFIFHTSDDGSVPIINALNFAAALYHHNVPVELHSFEHGRHGVGMAADNPKLKPWTDLLLLWLEGWT